MERKKFKDYLLLGGALLVIYYALLNLGAIAGFAGKLWSILSPFVLGAAIAFILNVPMRFVETKALRFMDRVKGVKGLKRPLAMVIVMTLAALVIYLVMSLVLPELAATLETIVKAIPTFIRQVDERLAPYQIQVSDFFAKYLTVPSGEELMAKASKMAEIALKGVVFSGSVIGSAYQGVLSGFFTLMFVIYFLLGKERLSGQVKQLMKAYLKPEHASRMLHVCRLSQRTFSSFITGQCLEAVILGLLFFLTLSLFRMPYVLLISVFIAVTALIPVVGAWIGCIVGTFLILVSNPMQALGFVALFLVVQQLEGNLVYPRVMGNAIGLPSIWVLFSVVLGEGLLGVIGMLIFIPLTSVAYQLLRDDVNRRLGTEKVE